MPTTPRVAPTIAEVMDDEAFRVTNTLILRNTSFGNFFDLCAISLPMPKPGLPAGLMLMGRNGADRTLLSLSLAVERLLAA